MFFSSEETARDGVRWTKGELAMGSRVVLRVLEGWQGVQGSQSGTCCRGRAVSCACWDAAEMTLSKRGSR